MNNLGAYNHLQRHNANVSDATKEFLKIFQIPETEHEHFRYRFRDLVSERVRFRKNGKLDSWNNTPFQSQSELFIDDLELELSKYSISSEKSIDTDKKIFIEEKYLRSRKHICTITKESLKNRLSILLDHVAFIAERESVTAKQIAAMSLELIANKDYDRKTSEVRKEIAETEVLAEKNCKLQFDKAAALIDILEIGKRKFTELRVICKPEGFTIPTYNKLAIYRRELALSSHVETVSHHDGYPIGVCIAYSKILTFTTERLTKQLSIDTTKFPLTIDVADGLDGSGSYKVYNQLQTNIDFSTKNFILMGLQMVTDFLSGSKIDEQNARIVTEGNFISH